MPFRDKGQQIAYQIQWVKTRREAWLKDHSPCARCGSPENLEVDHIDRATKVTHNVWSWSKDRRDQELAKCQALCVDCHKQKTYNEDLKERPYLRKVDQEGNLWCPRCRLFLAPDQFTNRKDMQRGKDRYCIQCRKIMRQETRLRSSAEERLLVKQEGGIS